MEEIASLVGSVGFPIAMCLVIMYYWNTQFTTEMTRLSDTVSQLNIAINKLLTKLDKDNEQLNPKNPNINVTNSSKLIVLYRQGNPCPDLH